MNPDNVAVWRARVEEAQRAAWAAWSCPVTSAAAAGEAHRELERVIADARAAGAMDDLGRWREVTP